MANHTMTFPVTIIPKHIMPKIHTILIGLFAFFCIQLPTFAFEFCRPYPNQSNYVVSFHESDVKDILEKAGMTNWSPNIFSRDSTGKSVFVSLNCRYEQAKNCTLVITDKNIKIMKYPQNNEIVSLYDNLSPSHWFHQELEKVWLVFSNGKRIMWQTSNDETSLFSFRSSPGNLILNINYKSEIFGRFVNSSNLDVTLFTIPNNKTNEYADSLFYKNDKIYLLGFTLNEQRQMQWHCRIYHENKGNWEQQKDVIIPNAGEIMDLDPESPNLICYRGGLFGQKSFVYNIETKKETRAHIVFWRCHGFFLTAGVVKNIQAALKGKTLENTPLKIPIVDQVLLSTEELRQQKDAR